MVGGDWNLNFIFPYIGNNHPIDYDYNTFQRGSRYPSPDYWQGHVVEASWTGSGQFQRTIKSNVLAHVIYSSSFYFKMIVRYCSYDSMTCYKCVAI